MAPKRFSRNPFINYFLKVQRQMRGRPVTVVAKIAGRRWKAMSMTQRLSFYQNCGQQSNWRSDLPSSRRWCSSGLTGNAPAVSRSPFINFFVQMYRQVGKNVPVTVVARAAGRRWKCMSIEERRPYYEGACRFGHRGSRRHG